MRYKSKTYNPNLDLSRNKIIEIIIFLLSAKKSIL